MTSSDPLILELQNGPRQLGALVLTVTDAQQRQPSAAGGFTVIEHACHLRDYEETCLHRLLRTLVETSPPLEDFDGGRLAVARNYAGQNLPAAVADFAAYRQLTLRVLTALSGEQWQREASLGNVAGLSVRQLAEIVADHDRDHLQQIERLLDELRLAVEEDTDAIRRMAREFTEGFNTGDIDRLMRFYGERYVDVNLRVPEQSNEERRAYYTTLIRRGPSSVRVHPDEICVHGPIAFGRGRIEVGQRDTDLTTELRYLEVLRKGPDGWKTIWGIDGPVQDYEPDSK
jgi:ketosteroid isomerase-like protein